MKNFEVKYSVDGKSGFSIIVSAPNSNTAKKVALGEIEGHAGYIGKKVRVSAVIEIR